MDDAETDGDNPVEESVVESDAADPVVDTHHDEPLPMPVTDSRDGSGTLVGVVGLVMFLVIGAVVCVTKERTDHNICKKCEC